MKVICAGFWKTGTKSLANALRHLGYKVYDYDDQFVLLVDLWEKFFDGSVTDDDIRERLSDVDVLIDGPVIGFWEEIYKAIPESKVILSMRTEDAWFRSFKGMIEKNPPFFKYLFLFSYLSPSGRRFIKIGLKLGAMLLSSEGPFSLPFFRIKDNPRLYKNLYRKHNCHVIQSIPQESLLIHESADGWDHLCRFLDKEIPNIPYPHLNKKGAHFNEEGGPKQPILKRVVMELLLIFSFLVIILAYIIYLIMT